MLRIAICDDVIEITSQLEDMVIEISNRHLIKVDIEIFYSGEDLLRYIKNQKNFDLIFLDIEMETLDGIEVALEIREHIEGYDTEIAFISGKSSYAMDLFQVMPINFLIKPLSLSKVEHVILTCLKINSKNLYFTYKKGPNYNKIKLKNIMFFESSNRKVNIVTKDNNTDSFYGLMNEVYEDIKDLGFLYIHKSYVVNTLYIKSYMYDKVILLNDTEIPISQSRRKSIRDKILSSNTKGV